MSKRAAIEIQFHWVFIIIVGAIILLFFSTLIFKQKTISEESTSADVLVNLESIISSSMISTKTLNLLDVPKGTEIYYKDCNSYSTGPFSKQTKTVVMFAPETIAGRKLITWALDWNMPFRVTNFLYLTSNEARYLLVDDDIANYGFVNEIDEDIMPDEITRDVVYYDDSVDSFKYIDGGAIKLKGDYKVRFVFYNVNNIGDILIPTSFKNLGSLDLTAVNILPTPDTDNRLGNVEFYRYDNSQDKFVLYDSSVLFEPYLKKEAAIGAIFSENPTTYKCALNKAYVRLSYVSRVYYNRTYDLANYYSSTDLPNQLRICSAHYYYVIDNNLFGDFINTFSSQELQDLNFQIPPSWIPSLRNLNRYSSSFSTEPTLEEKLFNCAYVSCEDSGTSLEEENRALQLRSCPPIY